MKKIMFAFALIASLALVSCTENKGGNANDENSTESTATTEQSGDEATAQVNPWPWDFPQNVKVEAEEGQYVLAPYTFYPTALEKGEDLQNKVLIFYHTKMKKVGEEKSQLEQCGIDFPNALIMPLDPNGTAKKGDILLTWWQGGSGLQRAIVKDASNPAEPVVDFLDLSYSDDPEKPGMAQRNGDKKLQPGSFKVINDGQWQQGAQLACKNGNDWEVATLINEQDGKVLVLGFSDKVKVFNKDDVKLVPFKENLKVGDTVWAKFASKYREGYKVTKVDMNLGRVWVEYKDGGKKEVLSICEVTKALN